MSGPPPLPPAAAGAAAPEPPQAVRAESLWEFHADERVVEAGIGIDGRVRVIDALGTFSVLDASGRAQISRRGETPLRGAALLPSGAAVLLTEAGRLQGLDAEGAPRFETPMPGATCVGASSRFVVLGAERHPVRVLSPSGKLRAQCVVEHPVAHVAPCSPQGHAVALSPSGQFSVVLGDQLLWRLHLRSNATALAATDAGLFVVAHREGAQAFTIEGTCLGIYDVGRPLRGLSVAADAPVLLLLDDGGGLHLVDLATGYSTWRESRARAQIIVRLSRDGRRGLSVASAGGVEAIGFVRGAERAERLEVVGRPAPAGDGIWRHVAAVVEDVEPSCRIAMDAGGTAVALSREQGERVEIVDAAGAVVTRMKGLRELSSIAFSADGARVVMHGHRGVATCRRDGEDRREIPGAFTHAVPGAGAGLVLVGTSPPSVRVSSGETIIGQTTLPSPVVHALVAPDLGTIVLADAAGRLTAWAAGHAPWRREHEARPGSLALGGPGIVAREGGSVVGLRLDGAEAWRCAVPPGAELFRLGQDVFIRESDNRFYLVTAAGSLEAVDARPNLGRSLLARVGRGDSLLEINVNGRVLTAFTPDGRIAWRCEAPDPVSCRDVLAGSGLLAFRAGNRLCLLPLHHPGPASDAAGRAAWLEL